MSKQILILIATVVLVIILTMLAMTIFGGKKDKVIPAVDEVTTKPIAEATPDATLPDPAAVDEAVKVINDPATGAK